MSGPLMITKPAARIGVRRETRHFWERRTPVTPALAAKLVKDGVEVWVQRNPGRIFTSAQYREVGATIVEEFGDQCPIILGVKY